MKPSEALDKAAEILERDDWIQGSYYQEPPRSVPDSEYREADEEAKKSAPCCQLGAIIRALTGTWMSLGVLPEGAEATVIEAHQFCRQLTGGHPIEWNDAPGRTKEEVVEMLKRAASLARETGE